MHLIDSERFIGRVIILYVLITVPLWRMLIQHKYGFFYPEIFVLGLLALLPCLAGAFIARKPIYFYGIVLILIVLQSCNSVQVGILPHVRLRWIILGLTVFTGTNMVLMRKRFFPILLIFLGGMLVAETARTLNGPLQTLIARERPVNARNDFHHIIYIIFDEFIGLEGIPSDIEGSFQAKSTLRQVFLKNNFTIYPFAFSNYSHTTDSIPSIVNNELLDFTGEYFSESQRRNGLRKNLLFEDFLKKGYSIRVYQSDYLNFAGPGFASLAVHTYNMNSLAAMHSIQTDWTKRLHQILTMYLRYDQFWWITYKEHIPVRFHPTLYRMGPLVTEEVWPSALLADIKAARQKTLFFAHLLIPHYPYVYQSDGRVRRLDEWYHGIKHDFYSESEYRLRYRNYMEQVEFLARQVDSFFRQLQAAGIYESTMMVIHGDHGSRLRLLDEGEREARMKLLLESPKCNPISRYDYVSAPKLQDLLNRFSTLLAIKPARASHPSEVGTKGSVLFFLRGVVWPPQNGSEGINSVHLFDAEGVPREIPLLAIWEGENKTGR